MPGLFAFVSSSPLLARPKLSNVTFCNRRVRRVQARRIVRCCPQANSGQASQSQAAPETSSSSVTPAKSSSILGAFTKITDSFTTLFPVWTILCSAVALYSPSSFSFIRPQLMTLSLSILMLSTGLTLTPSQLGATLKRPLPLLFSLIGCYALMPAVAYMLGIAFGLSTVDKAGLILVSIVSGGQMSNLCTLLARGDVALSVAMTTLSTVLSAVALPLLSKSLLAVIIPVDVTALANTVLRIVLLPVLVGCVMNALFPKLIAGIKPFLPVLGILSVCALIVSPVARTATAIPTAISSMLLPVVCLHVIGGTLGYVLPKLFGWSRETCVTTSFETAFKSPALAYVLALKHFPAPVGMASVVSIVVLAPLAALAAISLRALGRSENVKDGEEIREPFVAVANDSGREIQNERATFIVIRKDGRRFSVSYSGLAAEIDRAKRKGGILKIERHVPE